MSEQTGRTSFAAKDALPCSLPSGLYRRLRHRTGSADLPATPEALAGSRPGPDTAGGELHPALRTATTLVRLPLAMQVPVRRTLSQNCPLTGEAAGFWRNRPPACPGDQVLEGALDCLDQDDGGGGTWIHVADDPVSKPRGAPLGGNHVFCRFRAPRCGLERSAQTLDKGAALKASGSRCRCCRQPGIDHRLVARFSLAPVLDPLSHCLDGIDHVVVGQDHAGAPRA